MHSSVFRQVFQKMSFDQKDKETERHRKTILQHQYHKVVSKNIDRREGRRRVSQRRKDIMCERDTLTRNSHDDERGFFMKFLHEDSCFSRRLHQQRYAWGEWTTFSHLDWVCLPSSLGLKKSWREKERERESFGALFRRRFLAILELLVLWCKRHAWVSCARFRAGNVCEDCLWLRQQHQKHDQKQKAVLSSMSVYVFRRRVSKASKSIVVDGRSSRVSILTILLVVFGLSPRDCSFSGWPVDTSMRQMSSSCVISWNVGEVKPSRESRNSFEILQVSAPP